MQPAAGVRCFCRYVAGSVPGTVDFEAFVRARSGALVRTGYLLTGDAALAHDLVQEALVRTWPHWARISTGAPEAYVRTVMTRLQISWRRRKWRGEIPTERLPERALGQEVDADVDGELAWALAHLPVRQRQVVVLRYAEDLPVEQVAQILGCSAGTVKSQASRGLASLRAALGPAGGRAAGDRPAPASQAGDRATRDPGAGDRSTGEHTDTARAGGGT